jgi:hypothetical protein
MSCFMANAALRGSASVGNARARGSPGNAGNTSAKRWKGGNTSGSPGNAGNTSANRWKGGNTNARGSLANAGNVKKGNIKKRAGERSGVRRSAKKALVVKKKWLDLILAGRKTWEIRGYSTAKRGWIHFVESQAGGKLMGRARLVNCLQLPRKSFMRHYKQHCVPDCAAPYAKIYAWVLEDVEKFKKPFKYQHKQGAIWVDV